MKLKDSIEIKRKEITNWPKVAIIILNWNGWKDTIECLESVFRIDYPNYQVIVVDNGSTNDSVEKIKVWADGEQEVLTPEPPPHPLYHLSHSPVQKPILYIEYDRERAEVGGLPEKDKLLYNKLPEGIPHPLVLIQTGDNLGFVGGNDVGIKHALRNGSDYILVLNNDTVVRKDFLEPLVKTAQSAPDIGIVGGKIMYYDDPSRIECTWTEHKWGIGPIKIGEDEIDLGQYDNTMLVQSIMGAMMLVKADVFLEVGFFNESYFLYVDETEFCYRVKDKFKIIYEPRSVVLHKGSKTSGKESPVSLYYSRRNTLRFMTMYSSSKLELWFSLVRYLFTTLQKFFIYCLKGEPRKAQAVAKAYLDYTLGKSGKQKVSFKDGEEE